MTHSPTARRDDSPVLELRHYTLHPGRRDDLIALFEREFVEPQEAHGIRVLGTFRDLDRPDSFVWLRGFPSLAARAPALDAFYSGPVWRAHREAANATMIDSDDVLLLRPARPGGGAVLDTRDRAPAPGELVVATIYLLRAPADEALWRLFEYELAPRARAAGAGPIARFETEPAKNEFPRLPVREGVHAFVWLTSFANAGDYDRYLSALAALPGARAIDDALRGHLASPPQTLRLAPTARSLMRHADHPVTYSLAHTGGAHDFDFLEGAWSVVNHKLRSRGTRCVEWDDYPGESTVRLHLGGITNVDELVFPTRGTAGLTLRTFDLATRRWSIYWIASTMGTLLPPVHGGFTGDHGAFYGEDTDDGRPIKVRFAWTRIAPARARWEQAFSTDGADWEVNWIMDFTRR